MGILRNLFQANKENRCDFCGEGLGARPPEPFEGYVLCDVCRRDLEIALDAEADRQIEAYLLDLWYESRGLR